MYIPLLCHDAELLFVGLGGGGGTKVKGKEGNKKKKYPKCKHFYPNNKKVLYLGSFIINLSRY
jgi:hypothetical protein